MALQLLKRNYTMNGSGPSYPKILKNLQNEERWTSDSPKVDVGDVMMKLRMDPYSAHGNIVNETVTKYAKGRNPYGETSYRYVVNKAFRPPIVDPKLYEPLSRMPVKFQADKVSAGPIVSDLYKKQVTIVKTAPRMTIDRVCPDAQSKASRAASSRQDNPNLILTMKPKTSVQAQPSMPIHTPQDISMTLDPRISTSVNSGIHNPYVHSDFTRDVTNLRTPQHVAIKSNMQDVYQPGVPDHQLPNLAPKGPSTAGWNNPNYFYTTDFCAGMNNPQLVNTVTKINVATTTNPNYTLIDAPASTPIRPEEFIATRVHTAAKAAPNYKLVEHQGADVPMRTVDRIHASHGSNPSLNIEAGDRHHEFNRLHPTVNPGQYDARVGIPTIQEHPVYTKARESTGYSNTGYTPISEPNAGPQNQFPDQGWGVGVVDRPQGGLPTVNLRNAVRANPLRVNRDTAIPLYGMDSGDRLTPVDGNNKFVRW